MLNIIWLVMILVAVIVGGFSGNLAAMTDGAFKTAKDAVMEIALPLVGLMAIWLGMMRLAERAGLVSLLARALRPLMRRLFPEVPVDHPAMGAMVLNMSANMLGLGNAATPLGLRAMSLLQKLNPAPGVASNSMVTFLAINTASIQLVPTTAISILAVQGSKSASAIMVPALISTTVAMACGIVVARVLAPFFPVRPDAESAAAQEKEATPEPETALAEAPGLTAGGRVILAVFFVAFFAMAFILIAPQTANAFPERMGWSWRYSDFWPGLGDGQRVLRAISLLAVPFLFAFFPLYAHLRKVKVYEQFCEGAKDAFSTAQRIVPYLVAMLVSIRLLREAGVIKAITEFLRRPLEFVGFPPDLLPLALMRPLSGSASNGIFVDIVRTHGADSMLAKMSAVIYGSTETTFYVLAVYFGSVAVRKTRHAIIAGLTADVVAMVTAIAVCRLMLS
jgi:spore maturation protein SpmA/spore maturation protein SpmB